jgi:hypothetical protein
MGSRTPRTTNGESKTREILDEFRSVVLGRAQLLDAILPPVVFLAVGALAGTEAAMIAAIVTASVFVVVRALRRQPVTYALLGLGSSALAFLAARWLQRSEAFFLPDLVTQSVLAGACLVSIALRRPLVAWTSHVVRRWPRGWYWHPQVRPAYAEVTVAWGGFFLFQAAVQWTLLQQQQLTWLAAASLVNGWPATVVLLVVTYVYGTWRLRRLAGPSIAEFEARAAPPWTGQRRGF